MRLTYLLGALLIGSVVLVTTPGALARIAVIETRSGRTLEGELLTEDDDQVVLRVSGIDTPVARADIQTMTLKLSPLDVYEQRRATLADDDLDGRFALAYDLYDMKAYDLAKREIDDLHRLFPGETRVTRLAGVIDDTVALLDEQAATDPGTAARPAGNTRRQAPARPAAHGEIQTLQLTDDDINVIRVWELPGNLKADPVRIQRLPVPVAKRLLEEYASRKGVPKGRREQAAFYRADGATQIELIFMLRARAFYPEIKIVEDPPALKAFRRKIWVQYIIPYFDRHFGQGAVPDLALFGNRGPKLRSAYTDFYILSSYRQEDGAVMIDRQEPERSLLLQWGLPRNEADYPAPDVPGWRPYFTNTQDAKYQAMIEWIGSLYRDPDYGISYTPPTSQTDETVEMDVEIDVEPKADPPR